MSGLYSIHNLIKERKRDQGYRLEIRNLEIQPGAKIAFTGPSGCGKSTALDLLGFSLAPDSAEEFLFQPVPDQGAIDVVQLWSRRKLDKLAALRLAHMGYVLQSGELFPFLTVGENLTIMGHMKNMDLKAVTRDARALADALDIASLWRAMPDTLSVGERQRVAIGRALASHPQVILADEPTAALDPLHAQTVMRAFLHCVNEFGSALVLVTHDADWARSGQALQIPFELVDAGDSVLAILDGQNAIQPKSASAEACGL